MTVEQPINPQRRPWMRRLSRWVLLFAVLPYVFILATFGLLQRTFMYPAEWSEPIHAQNAVAPTGSLHDLRIRSHDGLELNGWLMLADGRAAESDEALAAELQSDRLVFLFFPGNAGNRSHRVDDCREFCRMGADVVIFDHRGYGDNPGSPNESDIAADALSIWKHLTRERGIAPNRIVIFGESLGGAIATRLAGRVCEDGESPAGLILLSTFSSMTATVSWHYPYFPVRYMLLDGYTSEEYIAKVTCPILVIHGDHDEIVPVELGRNLFAAAPEKSINEIAKRYVEVPLGGHNGIPVGSFRTPILQLMEDAKRE